MLQITRRALAAATALMLGPFAWAAGVFEKNGVALRGYDPVAYFTLGRAVQGGPQFQHRHGGALFHFSSAAHRDAFAADPERYMPQYGGYCAFGMAGGYKAAIDPSAFRIVDGRLYLNYNAAVQRQWSADIAGFITRADRNWPQVKEQAKVHE